MLCHGPAFHGSRALLGGPPALQPTIVRDLPGCGLHWGQDPQDAFQWLQAGQLLLFRSEFLPTCLREPGQRGARGWGVRLGVLLPFLTSRCSSVGKDTGTGPRESLHG